MSAVLCTLRSKTNDQCTLNLVFGYDVSTKFSFTGDKQSTVYLSGYYQPAPEDMGSDDEFDGEMSESESEDEEKAIITKAATKANGSKMEIPEDDDDSEDDDEDLEEDSVDEEFIKKMIQQNRAAGGDDSEDDSEEDDDEEEEDSEEEDSESEEEAPPAKVIKNTAGSTYNYMSPALECCNLFRDGLSSVTCDYS